MHYIKPSLQENDFDTIVLHKGISTVLKLDSNIADQCRHAGLLHKPKYYGISGISSFLSNRRLRVVLDGKSSQEYSFNAGVARGSILGIYINHRPDDVICNIAIYADDTTL